MATRKPYQRNTNTKPGAERNAFRPDVIETYQVEEDGLLLDFLIKAMPLRKRTNCSKESDGDRASFGETYSMDMGHR